MGREERQEGRKEGAGQREWGKREKRRERRERWGEREKRGMGGKRDEGKER